MGAVFCDIDGTIFEKPGEGETTDIDSTRVLPGSIEQLQKWYDDGHAIILTTARHSRLRGNTLAQLFHFGVPFTKLLMDLPTGVRILVNDNKPDSKCNRAIAISLNRNEGIHI